MSDIPVGDYYVVLFYDYANNGTETAGENDRYAIYDSVQYIVDALPVTITNGTTNSISQSFDDTYLLEAGGEYISNPGTLEVTATYTGLTDGDGTGNINAYVFSSLGTTAQSPLYQGSTSTLSSGVITISDIPVGDYYLVLFYDYADNGADTAGANDRYLIYNSAQYAIDAAPVTITSGATNSINQSFGNDYLFTAGGFFIVPPVGTLEVEAKYNGTITADAGATGQIFVYVYSSLTSTAQTPPDYQANTAVSIAYDTEYTITVSNVAAGYYYILVFYDFKKHTSNIPGKTDRYELYNDTGSKAAASKLKINYSTTTTLINVSFDNTNQFLDTAGYQP